MRIESSFQVNGSDELDLGEQANSDIIERLRRVYGQLRGGLSKKAILIKGVVFPLPSLDKPKPNVSRYPRCEVPQQSTQTNKPLIKKVALLIGLQK